MINTNLINNGVSREEKKDMEVFVLSMNNDKEWHSKMTKIFIDSLTATEHWNKIMLRREGELLQVKEVEKELKENGFLLFTFIDGFGRKWGIELNKEKIINKPSQDVFQK